MAANLAGSSSSKSSKKKGKEKQVVRTLPRSPAPEMQVSDRMEVDEGMESSSSSTFDRDPSGNFNIPPDEWFRRQHEAIPQTLPTVQSVGDGEQRQGPMHWHDPVQVDLEDVEIMRLQYIAGCGMTEAEWLELAATYTSDLTVSTDWDGSMEFGLENLLEPEVLNAPEEVQVAALRPVEPYLSKIGFACSYRVQEKDKYFCEVDGCGKSFDMQSALDKHQLYHLQDKDKPNKCLYLDCGKAFVLLKDLGRHVGTVHLQLKPFECPGCPARFGRKDQLRKHQKSPSGCKRVLNKASTASSSAGPETPSTGAGSVQKRSQKSKANSSTSEILGGRMEIVSHSSFLFPSTPTPGPR